MCQEVFELVRNMDLSNVEARLALQCAPVITGIKVANLLIVSTEDELQIERILKGTEIRYYCLFRNKIKSIYFLYRLKEFRIYMQEEAVLHALRQFEYTDLSMIGVLKAFQNRYESYMKQQMGFPHEMGILLGYPLEDVEGFIKNKGEKYLYAGYWKVYKEVEEKKLLFDAYESAKEGLVLLVANGYSIRKIIKYFQMPLYFL